MPRSYLSLFTLALTVGLASFGCAESADPSGTPTSDAGDDASGADTNFELPETSPPDDARADACFAETVKAVPVPLAMLVLIDRSGSMESDLKWESATKAIRGFADRADVVGMKMGLQFFPPTLTGGDTCNASLYKSLAVPIAELPGNTLPIQKKLSETAANGGATPMRSGLEGSIAAVRDFLATSTPHEGAVILVTDGDPTSCGAISTVASVAAGGASPPAGVARVRTFVVGMKGATFSNLDLVASSGGSTKAFDVGGGAASSDALAAALDAIRTGALGCEYVLPAGDSTKKINYDSVDVLFTPGVGDPTTSIKRVTNEAACGETTGGYFYDDPVNPKRIKLCPASCTTVRGGAASAKVEVYLGCVEIVK